MPGASPDPGYVGDYRLESALGRGGMGVVWRARNARTGATVALKTVAVAREQQLVAIRREVRALRRLSHPGIVRIVDDGVDRGRPWYAMELLEYSTLADLRTGSYGSDGLSEPSLLTYGDEAQVAEAPLGGADGHRLMELLGVVRSLCAPLGHLHVHGVVHGDLKPANIFVRPDNSAILVDFGVATRFGSQGHEQLEPARAAGGTLSYMAAEQLRGEPVDARADLYSLGCILYQLVTGRPPRTGAAALRAAIERNAAPAVAPSALGVVVDPRLESLIMRLLAVDRRQRLGHADDVDAALAELGVPGKPAGNGATAYLYQPALVERDAVLERLSALVVRCSEERGGLALVTGESGSGKTFLASAVAGLAAGYGLKVVVAECPPPVDAENAEPLPFLAFRPILELAAVHVVSDAQVPASLLQLLATLGALDANLSALPALSDLPPPPDLPPELQGPALLSAMTELVLALTEWLGILLIIDDLQWADSQSLAVLSNLVAPTAAGASRVSQSALAIVATYRRDEETPAIAALRGMPSVELETLARLGLDGVAQMTADMLALPTAPPALVQLLHRHSEGTPYFVAAYLHAAVADGYVRRVDGAWRPAAADVALVGLPSSIRDLLDRRLEAVPQARALLSAAAVLGRDFDERALVAVSLLPGSTVDDQVDDCLERRLLEASDDGTLRFTHDKLREAAYARVSPAERPELHRRAGEDLAARSKEGSVLVAVEHFRLAGATGALFDALLRAGGYAVRAAAFGSALDLLGEAEALATTLKPSPSLQARVQRLLGESLLATSDHAAGRLHLVRSLRLMGEVVPETPAQLGAGLALALLGQLRRRLRPPRRRVGLAREEDAAVRVHALAQLQVAARTDGDALRILYTTFRSLNLAEDLEVPEVMANGFALAQAIAGAVPWPAAASAYRRLAHDALAKARGEPVVAAWVHQMDGITDLGAGRLRDAQREADASLALAGAHSLSRRLQEGLIIRAFSSLLLGELEAAKGAYTQLVEEARGKSPRDERWGLLGLCVVAARRGEGLSENLRALQSLDSVASEPLDRLVGYAASALAGGLAAAADAAAGAKLLLSMPATLLEAALPATLLAEALWNLAMAPGRRPAGVSDCLKRVAARVGRMAGPQPFLRAEASLYRGAVAIAAGQRPRALAALKAAEAHANTMGMAVTAWRARRAVAWLEGRPADPRDLAFARELGLVEGQWLR